MKIEIKLELTKTEMDAFVNIIDCVSASLGEDSIINKNVKDIDKCLIRNGYKRKFK